MPRLSKITWIRMICGIAAVMVILFLLIAQKPWEVLAEIGTPTKPKHFAVIYEWWAAAFNGIVLLILGATVPWWLRSDNPDPTPWLPSVQTPRWFWPLVAGAMALTAIFGALRISQSVWDDEEHSLRRVILGEYRLRGNEVPKLKEAEWDDALWGYKKPTNHQFQTLLSKASLSLWREIARPSGLQFTEPVLRAPIYLAAILSVGALALLLKQLGFARAGVLAAFLLALHPWHIRYSIELRGYIFTILFVPLMLYCLLRAIESGRWRWWLAFGAAQFALIYSYAGCFYVLIAVNICGLVALWLRWPPVYRATYIPRLLVTSAVAGMLHIQLMLPCVPQLAEYLATGRALGVLTPRWHKNLMAHFASGIPWNNSDNREEGYPELRWMVEDSPWLAYALIVIPAILCLVGILRLLSCRPAGWIVFVTLLLPALAVYLGARLKGNYLYEWYVIFSLPGLVAAAALGAEWPGTFFERRRRWPAFIVPAALILVCATFATASQPARQWLLQNPLEPIKDAVLHIRPNLDPWDPRQKNILTAAVYVHIKSYDPHVIEPDDLSHLKEVAVRADVEKKVFYVVSGNDLALSVESPEIRSFLHDPRYFTQEAVLKGYDPTLTQYIWKYIPQSLDSR